MTNTDPAGATVGSGGATPATAEGATPRGEETLERAAASGSGAAPDGAQPVGAQPVGELTVRARKEVERLTRELAEIELLATQARTEAGRHEQKRAQAAERLAAMAGQPASATELAEANAQLLTLTRRAGVMEAQVDVLEGKHKALTRYRDGLDGYATSLAAMAGVTPAGAAGGTVAAAGAGVAAGAAAGGVPPDQPALSRAILTAQEDLRRDIARAMHDGPAQSLTNIVLQAQIVEHLLSRDAASAGVELRQLVSMVQQTLEATKAFIFDVRPMVLDDLGLVPTLRRTARDRGRRAQVPIDFESMGADRRLPMDLESGVFRILDEALGGYLAAKPDRMLVHLDWGDTLEVRLTASRAVVTAEPKPEPEPAPERSRKRGREEKRQEEMPAALAEMIAEQREGAARAAKAAESITLPPSTWREIQQRAATLGVAIELREDGREVRMVVDAAQAA